jgi:hypothetical protein
LIRDGRCKNRDSFCSLHRSRFSCSFGTSADAAEPE